MSEQIFISYRREGGVTCAKLICEALKNHGYTVFFDFDSIRGGFFDERIFDAIDGCKDFILVLPENSLDRCVNEDDWVRQEIAYALKKKKNIIPVMLEGFTFPAELPEEIEIIRRIQAIQMVINYFDLAVVPSIVDRLVSYPSRQFADRKDASRDERPSLIRNVCSFGSCDFDNTSPADAHYSERIDRTKYNVVYFNVSTAPIRDRDVICSRLTIYDEKNNVTCDDVADYEWKPNYNQLTRSWVVRGRDGSFVRSGKYRAVFQIDGSREYEYEFEIVSGETGLVSGGPSGELTERQKNARRHLACAKGFRYCLLSLLSLVVAAVAMNNYVSFLAMIAIGCGIFFWGKLLVHTWKNITKNILVLLVVMTVGYFWYALFLFVFWVLSLFMGRKWKSRLNS